MLTNQFAVSQIAVWTSCGLDDVWRYLLDMWRTTGIRKLLETWFWEKL